MKSKQAGGKFHFELFLRAKCFCPNELSVLEEIELRESNRTHFCLYRKTQITLNSPFVCFVKYICYTGYFNEIGNLVYVRLG